MHTIDVEPEAGEQGTAMLHEYWNMAVRRKWVIIGSILLSLAVAGIYCTVAPKVYRSETLILVEDQKMPETYVQGVAEGNLEQRIFVIQKQIGSRALLGEIVNEFQLYADETATHGPAAAIAKVSAGVKVEMVGKTGHANFVGRNSVDAFTVSFSHEDPGTAMKVTERIAAKFIEENMRAREQTAEGTTEFLDSEVVTAKSALEKKEDEIRQFKAAHMGELPEQIEANLRALDRLQSDLNTVNESMQRLADRLTMVEKAIQDYERFGRTHPTLATGPVGPDPLFRRLNELKEKLVKLTTEFWDSYPDVILAKEEISRVERELTALYGPDAIKPGEKPPDPYYQDLKKQRSEVGTDLALLKQRQQLLQAEKKDYEKRVEAAPAIEQELLILMRDYENMRNNYRSLLDKRLNARVAENLEKVQKGGQFRIIDPANFPIAPEKPKQGLIMIFGLIFGCALGIGIVMVQEQLTPQFGSPEDVERLLGPQLLAIIPDFGLARNRTTWQRLLPSYRPAGGEIRQNGGGEPQAITLGPLPIHGGDAQSPAANLIAKWQPSSIAAEQYRIAAARLTLVRSKERSTILAVTSAIKGEGKTTTVVNLGYTLARDLGKRTVLVDCDFRCPMLHRYAESAPERGLADCLSGEISLEESLSGFGEVPCSIMSVGNCENPSNYLLKTERLASIFSQLRKRFDYILLNTPPILALADMNILAGHADVLLLVVRANMTTRQIVTRAVGSLGADKPIYTMLNGVREQSFPYYYYYTYEPQKPRSYSR